MTPAKSKTLPLNRIDAATAPQSFFKNYVSTRTPVILTGLLKDPSFKATKWTDLSYLSEKAGNVDVMVEPIHPDSQQFGTDIERISMPFSKFIDKLKEESGKQYYLTTQYTTADEEDEGDVVSYPPPTNALKDEFPSSPSLTGNLVLQQVNLWIGKSKEGASSGLHHDFHDNLYCLLLGHKRFIIFPPTEAAHLYPHGTIDKIHGNGLISYRHNVIRSDGLTTRDAAKFRVKALEKKMDKAKGMERKKLESLHEEAVDAMMEFLLEGGLEENDDDDFADIDLGDGGEDVEDDDGDLDDDRESNNEDDDEQSMTGKGKGKAPTETAEEEGEPSSFSRIPTAILHKHLDLPTTAILPPSNSSSYDLTRVTIPYVVNLNPGEMLYLPASWWHEVTSSEDSSKDHIHMAFNYWFYPPDGLKQFDKPYEDELIWEYLRTLVSPEKDRSGKRKMEDEKANGSRKSRKQ